VGPAQRAASLAAAVRRHDLVLGGWTAAWVHGATERLRRPLDLQTDSSGGARAKHTPLRQVALGSRDVVRIGGVRVTSPFRTAADLARLEHHLGSEGSAAVVALIAATGLTWAQAVAALAATPTATGKRRALARFRTFRDEGQPADTR
jgi:hypothetical protein